MHPSFGVPWPRLQRAAARLNQLHALPHEGGRVHALLFLCGLKYLLTYREANGRRLSHYIDDGLREAVEHTLPVLMDRCLKATVPRASHSRESGLTSTALDPLDRIERAFLELHLRFPAATARWLEMPEREANLIRLDFGMGVAARFHPASHGFVREWLGQPLNLPRPVLDVVESFHWHPDWSLVLAR